VLAELFRTVHDDGVALGGESIFMRVARDARDALQSKVERLCGEPCFLQKRDEEGPQTGVDVEGNAALQSDPGEADDIVNDSVWEVWCGACDEDGVVIDHAIEGFGVDFERDGVDGDVMDFDAEVGAGFVEGCMDCNGDDPAVTMSTTRSIGRWG